MKQKRFKMPNEIILNTRLSLSARKLAAALYAFRSGDVCRKSIRELAAMTHMAPNTIRNAVDELERAGYTAIGKKWRWDAKKGCLLRDTNAYSISTPKNSYSLIPYSILTAADLSAGDVAIAMYLICAAGAKGRAYPSINYIAKMVGVAHSTVCSALSRLRQCAAFVILRCKKIIGCFASNSYLVTVLKEAAVQCSGAVPNIAGDEAPTHNPIINVLLRFGNGLRRFFNWMGSPKFDTLRVTKDTKVITLGRKRNFFIRE